MMRHELMSDVDSAGPLAHPRETSVSVEALDQGIHMLKHLIDQLGTIKKEVESLATGPTDDLRLPQEVVHFHARKETVQCERQIREVIRDIFGVRSPEFLKHQHLRIGFGSKTGISHAMRALQDLAFLLEERRCI